MNTQTVAPPVLDEEVWKSFFRPLAFGDVPCPCRCGRNLSGDRRDLAVTADARIVTAFCFHGAFGPLDGDPLASA